MRAIAERRAALSFQVSITPSGVRLMITSAVDFDDRRQTLVLHRSTTRESAGDPQLDRQPDDASYSNADDY